MGDYAWFVHNAFKLEAFREVGTRLPNAWGLYDMQGNVFELCHDWLGDYTSDSQVDPVGSSDRERAFRGGAYAELAVTARPAWRFSWSAGGRHYGLGARLLRTGPRIGEGPSSIAPRSWGRIKHNSR